MGSRMMHYAIGVRANERLRLPEEPFLLGSLAPDVHKYMGQSKSISHFARKDENGRIHADFRGFYAKYAPDEGKPFHLGYYYHLISDDLWLSRIYLDKIKPLPPERKQEAQAQYYRDFWRLNGKLIDHYSLRLSDLTVRPEAIDEINCRLLPELVKDVVRDFKMADLAKDEPLELLSFEEVVSILEESIQRCLEDGLTARVG
ncbi:hypothetical protein MO973_13680 [Paenibacillus sp. TRM 82003]|nr:hypothetical protein [Paenibacillus sp. TRM 82003]